MLFDELVHSQAHWSKTGHTGLQVFVQILEIFVDRQRPAGVKPTNSPFRLGFVLYMQRTVFKASLTNWDTFQLPATLF